MTLTHSSRVLQQDPLLATKLYIPPAPSKLVLRPHLVEQLDEGIQGKLTLICAPAGFGKTSMLCEWYAVHPKNVASVAWVSLDVSDNDGRRFWSYVFAALERLHPDIVEDAFVLLRSPQPPSMNVILTTLINALLAIQGQIILILDDYHVITEPSIHQAMSFLLDYLPPQMHLILASRSDPPLLLSRLRSNRTLTELRTDDLRFTNEETKLFLQLMTGSIPPTETIATLEQRTEGWIAGLQLAALSLKGRTNSTNFITAFAGSHKYILDYLSEEVLRQQSDAIQTFLLQTAILDRLSGPLCNAVTEQSNSQTILEQLEQANLFIVPLDDERGWYRYHHLFTEVLRRQLQYTHPDMLPRLHQRAAIWYEQQGLITEAMRHALAATDFERAVRLIEQATIRMLLQGERNILQQWLQALPSELLQRHPRLCITYAMLLAYNVQLDAAESYLRLAEAHLLPSPEGEMPPDVLEMLGEIDGIRADLARHQGDIPRAIALCRQALERIPQDNVFLRGNINLNLGAAYAYNGDMEAAQQALTAAVELGQAAGNLHGVLYALYRLTWQPVHQGQLRQAYNNAQRALQFVETHPELRKSPDVGLIYSVMGGVLHEWNKLEAAAEALIEGITLCEQNGVEMAVVGGAYTTLAQVRQDQGAADQASVLMQQAVQGIHNRRTTVLFSARIPFHQVRLWIAQGKLDDAFQWLLEYGPKLHLSGVLSYQQEIEYLTVVRVLLAQSQRGQPLPYGWSLKQVLHLTEQIAEATEAKKRWGHVIEALVLQALLLQAQGDPSSALTILRRALTLAEPEGYIRIFVDEGQPMAALLQRALEAGILHAYVITLLHAFGVQPEVQQEETVPLQQSSLPLSDSTLYPLLEPLSERELEVLRLMAAGRSNSEIARALSVSVGTIKTHLKHIYGKLGVHTRTQAIAHARELRLLPL